MRTIDAIYVFSSFRRFFNLSSDISFCFVLNCAFNYLTSLYCILSKNHEIRSSTPESRGCFWWLPATALRGLYGNRWTRSGPLGAARWGLIRRDYALQVVHLTFPLMGRNPKENKSQVATKFGEMFFYVVGK